MTTQRAETLHGVDVRKLDDGQTRQVLAEVFGRRRRCALLTELDPGAEQWVLAELGDGRITGSCPTGEDEWRLSCFDPDERARKLSAPPLAADLTDVWRVLEISVFTKKAQIRIGEGAKFAHRAVDDGDHNELPRWLKPRNRSFLLLGWPNDKGRFTERLGGTPAMTRAHELSGSQALHPLRWEDFGVLRGKDLPEEDRLDGPVSKGSWLGVREYWAQDDETGEVYVAYHRITGYTTGMKPTRPLVTGAPAGLVEGDDE